MNETHSSDSSDSMITALDAWQSDLEERDELVMEQFLPGTDILGEDIFQHPGNPALPLQAL